MKDTISVDSVTLIASITHAIVFMNVVYSFIGYSLGILCDTVESDIRDG